MVRFRRRETEASSSATASSGSALGLGSGLLLRVRSEHQRFALVLDALARSYGDPPYEQMPGFSLAGWVCNDDTPPLWVGAYENRNGEPEFAAVWAAAEDTRVAVIPLGQGDDRLGSMTTVKDLDNVNASAELVGILPAGSLSLRAPTIDVGKFDEFLKSGGLPVSEKNRILVHRDLHFQFLVKAMQSPPARRDARAWDQFVNAHKFTGMGTGSAQAVLTDLIAWDPRIAPYLQDWQDRYQALMLDVVPQSDIPWSDYDR